MEAVDRQTIIDEDKDAIGSFISIFANVLLAFAGIALFVSAFIINNTFAIILGQRVRNWPCSGPSAPPVQQVRRLLVGEAVIIGLLATVVGIGLGILVAVGLKSLFNAIGFGLPWANAVLAPRTLHRRGCHRDRGDARLGFGPARRARADSSRWRPCGPASYGSGCAPRRRVIVGVVLTLVGALLLASGLSSSGDDRHADVGRWRRRPHLPGRGPARAPSSPSRRRAHRRSAAPSKA